MSAPSAATAGGNPGGGVATAQRPMVTPPPAALAAMQRGRERAAAQSQSAGPQAPIVRKQERVGRNDPCPCGSGKKYKRCCYPKFEA
jgi:preprotein translocase subunit SecA